MNANNQPIKQLPLGIADFERLRQQNYYYVDKTMFLPRMELTSSYLFLVRPRRFGKSLLLSMLGAYYDVNMKDRFDELFGDLWISQHPTSYKNYYAVLHLDFSQVTGSIDELRESFDSYCGIKADSFAKRYESMFYEGFADEVKKENWATKKLNYIGDKAKEYNVPMYLIVDEYDNFTNTVLNQHGEDVYMGLTHGEGFYRDIFKNSMACVLSIAYYYAHGDYIFHREYQTGLGFADLVLTPRRNVSKPAVIVELKYGHSADEAIGQIKARHYTDKIAEYMGDILLVGINYDRDTKEHTCLIERWHKD